MHQRSSSKLRFDQGTMMMKFIRQGNYCLFSHIHKLIKMASDGHAKIYFVLGKLKLSLSCMKSVSSKSIDWACSSNQCFDALIEIKRIIISISSQHHSVQFIQLQMKIAIDSPHNISSIFI